MSTFNTGAVNTCQALVPRDGLNSEEPFGTISLVNNVFQEKRKTMPTFYYQEKKNDCTNL